MQSTKNETGRNNIKQCTTINKEDKPIFNHIKRPSADSKEFVLNQVPTPVEEPPKEKQKPTVNDVSLPQSDIDENLGNGEIFSKIKHSALSARNNIKPDDTKPLATDLAREHETATFFTIGKDGGKKVTSIICQLKSITSQSKQPYEFKDEMKEPAQRCSLKDSMKTVGSSKVNGAANRVKGIYEDELNVLKQKLLDAFAHMKKNKRKTLNLSSK